MTLSDIIENWITSNKEYFSKEKLFLFTYKNNKETRISVNGYWVGTVCEDAVDCWIAGAPRSDVVKGFIDQTESSVRVHAADPKFFDDLKYYLACGSKCFVTPPNVIMRAGIKTIL